MIFVTIGMMYGFERLIKWMDIIAGSIDEEVIMQIGDTSNYTPVNSNYFTFAPRDRLIELCKNARIIVCHAGVGSLLMALENKSYVIAVPRNKELGEAVDNHQFEIARELEKEGRIRVANTFEDLKSDLSCTCTCRLNNKTDLSRNAIIDSLRKYISQYD